MSTRTADYLDAIEHLPEGATLVIQQFSWDDYERLVEELQEQGLHVRVSYDRGRLEIMSPLLEHEEYGGFIDDLVRAFSNAWPWIVRPRPLSGRVLQWKLHFPK